MDSVNWKPLLHAGEVVLHLLPTGTSYSSDTPKGSPCVLPLFGYSADWFLSKYCVNVKLFFFFFLPSPKPLI